MAVVNTKGTLITNLDASPLVNESVTQYSGKLRCQFETLEVANGDSIASTLRFARIPSSAKIASIRIFCDAITSAAADIGLYRTLADGGAVVDVDAYATAQSIASAITTGTEVMFEARNIDKARNYVWQDAGLTTDPKVQYDVVLTLTAAATAAGTVTLEVWYVVD